MTRRVVAAVTAFVFGRADGRLLERLRRSWHDLGERIVGGAAHTVSRGREYDVHNVDCPASGGRFFTAGDIEPVARGPDSRTG